MATYQQNNLQAFRDFANEILSSDEAGLSLSEALELWEYQNSPASEKQSTFDAIRRGLDDCYAGRTIDAFEFVERMRDKLQSRTAQPWIIGFG